MNFSDLLSPSTNSNDTPARGNQPTKIWCSCKILRVLWIPLIISFVVPEFSLAAAPKDINKVVLTVDTQGAAERERGVRLGLAEILVRLSGLQSVIDDPAAGELIDKAETYLLQYSYEDLVVQVEDEQVEGAELDKTIKQLILEYDHNALMVEMKRRGLPMWGLNRPPILIWWAQDDAGPRRLIGAEDVDDVNQLIDANQVRRGLPVVMPLLDLEDQSHIKVSDVWGFFSESVAEASERYGSSVVLMAKSRQLAPDRWSLSWNLSVNNVETWDERIGADLSSLTVQLFDHVAERLATLYAVVPSAEERLSVAVTVEGIHGLEQYAQLMAYLDNMVAIEKAVPVRIEGDVIDFQFELVGELEQLERTIALDGKMREIESSYESSLAPKLVEGESTSLQAIVEPTEPIDLQRYNQTGKSGSPEQAEISRVELTNANGESETLSPKVEEAATFLPVKKYQWL